MAEKRNNKRVRVNMRVNYSVGAHSDKMAEVMDISKGGMYVKTSYAPEVNGYLMASLDAEAFGKVIWVEGRVVRKTLTGMAVTFTDTDKKGLNTLLTSRRRSLGSRL
jgi:hypothetical protein